MIVINFKNYLSGPKVNKLATAINQFLPKAIICPPLLDSQNLALNSKLQVFSQHVSYKNSSRDTGFTTIKSLKANKISGSLINHAEHQLFPADLKKTLEVCSKNNLKVIACAPNLEIAKLILSCKHKPFAVAFEDPRLIGTGKSITEFNPSSIERFVQLAAKARVLPLCGAGISSAKDVKESFDLGCKGVLMASAIAKRARPINLLKSLRPFQ